MVQKNIFIFKNNYIYEQSLFINKLIRYGKQK